MVQLDSKTGQDVYKRQVVEGGGEILPSEKGHFSRKQQQDHWRLGCQVKVKGDLGIKIDESVVVYG